MDEAKAGQSAPSAHDTEASISIGDALEELLVATHQLEFAVASMDDGGGFAFTELFVLRTLLAQGDTRIGELAKAVRISRQRLNQIVRALEKKSFILVTSPGDDARVRMVSITQEGKGAVAALREKLFGFAERLGPSALQPKPIMHAARIAKRLSTSAWKLRKGREPGKSADAAKTQA